MRHTSPPQCRELRLGRGLHAALLYASLAGPPLQLTAQRAGAGLGWLELIAAATLVAGLLGVATFVFAAEARACWALLRSDMPPRVHGWTPHRIAFVVAASVAAGGLVALVPALFAHGVSARAYLVLASGVLAAAFAAFAAWTRGLVRGEAWARIDADATRRRL